MIENSKILLLKTSLLYMALYGSLIYAKKLHSVSHQLFKDNLISSKRVKTQLLSQYCLLNVDMSLLEGLALHLHSLNMAKPVTKPFPMEPQNSGVSVCNACVLSLLLFRVSIDLLICCVLRHMSGCPLSSACLLLTSPSIVVSTRTHKQVCLEQSPAGHLYPFLWLFVVFNKLYMVCK